LSLAVLLAVAASIVNPAMETAQADAYGERSRYQHYVQLRQSGQLK